MIFRYARHCSVIIENVRHGEGVNMLASRKHNWVPHARSMRTLYVCVEIVLTLDPLTAGAAYIRVFIFY